MKEKCNIIVDNISKAYSGKGVSCPVIQNVSFAVKPGEFVMVCGESGSGKSTLLNLLAGFEKPDAGVIFINGANIVEMNESDCASYRLNNTGFIFQQFHLIPELTAKENVMLPLLLQKQKKADAIKQALKLLGYVGLGDRANHLPAELSGGQQQRVGIARALSTNPSIIFADEPTGNLDTKNRQEVMSLLCNINSETGTTILMVTHSLEEQQYGTRTIAIKDGVVV